MPSSFSKVKQEWMPVGKFEEVFWQNDYKQEFNCKKTCVEPYMSNIYDKGFQRK